MNAINKIELNQEINANYDKLVYLYEHYEFTLNNFEKLKTDLKRDQKRDIAGYYISHNIRLPIEELNGIKVDIFIHFAPARIRLEIQAKTISRNHNCYTYNTCNLVCTDHNSKLEFRDYITAFNKLEDILKYYKFNNFIGEFINTKIKKSKDINIAFNKMLSINNIKRAIQECCVCFEHTQVKTDCNHILCYKCWENIRGCNKQCPICREFLDVCTDDFDDDDDYDDDYDDN
jgi:hypothetical protein